VSVTVTESGYPGAFPVKATSCAGIASVAAAPTSGTYTITGVAAGTCAITFADAYAQSVALPVIVTTTTGTITIP